MSTDTGDTNAQEGLAPLEPDWLLAPLPSHDTEAPDLEAADSRFETISALILKGEYVSAGRESQTLLHNGIFDVRVLGYYLFGVFIERGLPNLPFLFRVLLKFLGEDLAAWGPRYKKQLQTENMLLWLISGVLKNVELHSTLKDSTWKQWLDVKNRGAVDEAMQLCPQMQVALATFAPQSRAALRFQSLDGWLGSFGHGETGVTKKSAQTNAESKGSQSSANSKEGSERSEQSSEPAHDGPREPEDADEHASFDDDEPHDKPPDHQADEHDEPPFGRDPSAPFHELRRGGPLSVSEIRAERERRQMMEEQQQQQQQQRVNNFAAAPGPAEGSAQWQVLLERLQAFSLLVGQGQYLKAAVVATDIQAAVAAFDPVVYFPALFAPYLSSFAEHMRPLEHYLNDPQAVKFKVLRQLYQVDFEKFMRRD